MPDTLKDVISQLQITLIVVNTRLGELTDDKVKDSLEHERRSFAFLQQCAKQLLENINTNKQRDGKTCLGESAAKMLYESAASMEELCKSDQLNDQQQLAVKAEAENIAEMARSAEALINNISRS